VDPLEEEDRIMDTSSLLQTRAEQALRQSRIPALRKLRIEDTDEAVILAGSVATYYLKQLAQEAVMPLLGDRELRNRVTVVRS
jgi:hypothetical protein